MTPRPISEFTEDKRQPFFFLTSDTADRIVLPTCHSNDDLFLKRESFNQK